MGARTRARVHLNTGARANTRDLIVSDASGSRSQTRAAFIPVCVSARARVGVPVHCGRAALLLRWFSHQVAPLLDTSELKTTLPFSGERTFSVAAIEVATHVTPRKRSPGSSASAP